MFSFTFVCKRLYTDSKALLFLKQVGNRFFAIFFLSAAINLFSCEERSQGKLPLIGRNPSKGERDGNDAQPYDDAYDSRERNAIAAVLGEQILPQRWKNSKRIYLREGAKAELKTNVGHEHPEKVKQEIVEFFKKAISERP